mmetsp:Transcript_6179/g.15343  ORF Transcript_6179/g.15343 Transcript_6179/m.15343 type:complete len:299 (+) Transcript_6179:926-1822(+)
MARVASLRYCFSCAVPRLLAAVASLRAQAPRAPIKQTTGDGAWFCLRQRAPAPCAAVLGVHRYVAGAAALDVGRANRPGAPWLEHAVADSAIQVRARAPAPARHCLQEVHEVPHAPMATCASWSLNGAPALAHAVAHARASAPLLPSRYSTSPTARHPLPRALSRLRHRRGAWLAAVGCPARDKPLSRLLVPLHAPAPIAPGTEAAIHRRRMFNLCPGVLRAGLHVAHLHLGGRPVAKPPCAHRMQLDGSVACLLAPAARIDARAPPGPWAERAVLLDGRSRMRFTGVSDSRGCLFRD